MHDGHKTRNIVGETTPPETQVPIEESKAEEKPQRPPPRQIIPPNIPYQQRLKKSKLDNQFAKFLDVFKKLYINIPFAEALENMPSYAKFLKEILARKQKVEDYETVALTEECSAII